MLLIRDEREITGYRIETSSSHDQPHDGVFFALMPIENSGQGSFMHHSDTIARAEDFLHIAADHQDGNSSFRQAAHELINFSFTSMRSVGSSKIKTFGSSDSHLARTTFC